MTAVVGIRGRSPRKTAGRSARGTKRVARTTGKRARTTKRTKPDRQQVRKKKKFCQIKISYYGFEVTVPAASQFEYQKPQATRGRRPGVNVGPTWAPMATPTTEDDYYYEYYDELSTRAPESNKTQIKLLKFAYYEPTVSCFRWFRQVAQFRGSSTPRLQRALRPRRLGQPAPFRWPRLGPTRGSDHDVVNNGTGRSTKRADGPGAPRTPKRQLIQLLPESKFQRQYY